VENAFVAFIPEKWIFVMCRVFSLRLFPGNPVFG